MTDEGTATLSALDEETDAEARFRSPADAPEQVTFSQAFLASLDAPADASPAHHNSNGNGASVAAAGSPPHLRTAWKRKQDTAHPQPGKPSARPALTRGTARPGAGGVRAHLPGPDGLPVPAPAVPPLPPLTHAASASALVATPRPAPPRPALMAYPMGVNPKAKPRGGAGRGERPPGGTLVAGAGNRPLRPKIEQWIGTALIAIGVLVAVGAFGGNYLVQRHNDSENAAFASSLSQFGPTPTPLTARATQVAAARGSANAGGAGGGGGNPPRPTAPSGGVADANAAILPLPATRVSTAPAIGGGPNGGNGSGINGNGANGGNGIDGALPRSTPRPTAPGTSGGPAVAPGGPPPIVVGGGPPAPRPQLTATPRPAPPSNPLPMDTPSPRPPDRNIAPPPIAPVQLPPSTATPQPAPVQPALNADGMATAEPEPEPTPTPEPPPRQPLPSRLSIPVLKVNSDVNEVGISPTEIDGQEVYIWDVAAYAVGHHFSSANPGEGENVVFSGHDDWQGEVFRDLYKLKKGDKLSVQAGGKTWSYHVDSVLLLQEVGVPLEQRLNNALYIGTTGDERLTLITCWPYGVDDHRLVVIAKPDWCSDC